MQLYKWGSATKDSRLYCPAVGLAFFGGAVIAWLTQMFESVLMEFGVMEFEDGVEPGTCVQGLERLSRVQEWNASSAFVQLCTPNMFLLILLVVLRAVLRRCGKSKATTQALQRCGSALYKVQPLRLCCVPTFTWYSVVIAWALAGSAVTVALRSDIVSELDQVAALVAADACVSNESVPTGDLALHAAVAQLIVYALGSAAVLASGRPCLKPDPVPMTEEELQRGRLPPVVARHPAPQPAADIVPAVPEEPGAAAVVAPIPVAPALHGGVASGEEPSASAVGATSVVVDMGPPHSDATPPAGVLGAIELPTMATRAVEAPLPVNAGEAHVDDGEAPDIEAGDRVAVDGVAAAVDRVAAAAPAEEATAAPTEEATAAPAEEAAAAPAEAATAAPAEEATTAPAEGATTAPRAAQDER